MNRIKGFVSNISSYIWAVSQARYGISLCVSPPPPLLSLCNNSLYAQKDACKNRQRWCPHRDRLNILCRYLMDFLVMRMRRRAIKTMVKAYLPTIPLSFIQVMAAAPQHVA